MITRGQNAHGWHVVVEVQGLDFGGWAFQLGDDEKLAEIVERYLSMAAARESFMTASMAVGGREPGAVLVQREAKAAWRAKIVVLDDEHQARLFVDAVNWLASDREPVYSQSRGNK